MTNALQQIASEQLSRPVSVQEVEEMLQPLIERGLMVKEDNSYLSLAVPVGEYLPEKSVLKRLISIIAKQVHQVSKLNDWCEVID